MATLFCIVPTLALDGIIDFTTDEGCKYFKRAIKKLSDDTFDLAPKDRHLLTNLLTKRVDEIGWNVDIVGITLIFLDPIDSNLDVVNILTNHREVSLESICNFESICVT